MIDYTRPPSNLARAREVLELIPRAYRGLGHLGPRGPVDGPKCLVVPGFIATDRTSMELRRAFAAGGWHTFGWGMGLNRGARADTLHRMGERLEEVAVDGQVLLVGWSLGGVFARELAREHAGRVTAVVTLGSPF